MCWGDIDNVFLSVNVLHDEFKDVRVVFAKVKSCEDSPYS